MRIQIKTNTLKKINSQTQVDKHEDTRTDKQTGAVGGTMIRTDKLKRLTGILIITRLSLTILLNS